MAGKPVRTGKGSVQNKPSESFTVLTDALASALYAALGTVSAGGAGLINFKVEQWAQSLFVTSLAIPPLGTS